MYEPDVMFNKKLCEWDPTFVGIVQFTDDGQVIDGLERVFQVNIQEVWKGPTSVSKICTARDSAACGLSAQKDDQLLISAYLRDGCLHVNSCSSVWIDADADVVPSLKRKLANCQ